MRFHVKNHLSENASLVIGADWNSIAPLTVSGLIFSWNPISQIRGEDNIKQPVKVDQGIRISRYPLLGQPDLIPPEQSVIGLELKSILGRLFLILNSTEGSKACTGGRDQRGSFVPNFRVEAEAIAIDDFAHPAKVLESTFIDQVQDGHSNIDRKRFLFGKSCWTTHLRQQSMFPLSG